MFREKCNSMNFDNINIPPAKLPTEVELILFLIKEEIKNRKFTEQLGKIGFDTTICTIDFSKIILSLVGYENIDDQLYLDYFKLIDSYIEKFDLWEIGKPLHEHAFNVYIDLMVEKRLKDRGDV